MKAKILNVVGVSILGGLLMLLSGAIGDPIPVGNSTALAHIASAAR